MCRINQDNPLDRMQKVIDRLNGDDPAESAAGGRLREAFARPNGKDNEGPAQVIKINLEIPLTNATKYLTSIRDFLSALIPKGKADGSD